MKGASCASAVRSANIWREAYVPAPLLETLNSWVDPRVPELTAASPTSVTVDLDLQRGGEGRARPDANPGAGRPAARLWRPREPAERYRQEFRDQVLRFVPGSPYIYRLLSQLTEAQWTKLQGKGLALGKDLQLGLTPEEARRWPLLGKSDSMRFSVAQGHRAMTGGSAREGMFQFFHGNVPHFMWTVPVDVVLSPEAGDGTEGGGGAR